MPEKQKHYSFGLISTLNPYVGSGCRYPGTTCGSHHQPHSLRLVGQNSGAHGRHWSLSGLNEVGWRGRDAKCIGYIGGGKVIHLIIEQNPSSFSSDSWAKPEKKIYFFLGGEGGQFCPKQSTCSTGVLIQSWHNLLKNFAVHTFHILMFKRIHF